MRVEDVVRIDLGTFVLDATLSYLQPAIWPWKPTEEGDGTDYENQPPEALALAVWRFVRDNPGMTGRTIRTAVKGKTDAILWALEWLVDHEFLSGETGPRRAITYMVAADYEAERFPTGSASGSESPGTTPQAPDQGVFDE